MYMLSRVCLAAKECVSEKDPGYLFGRTLRQLGEEGRRRGIIAVHWILTVLLVPRGYFPVSGVDDDVGYQWLGCYQVHRFRWKFGPSMVLG